MNRALLEQSFPKEAVKSRQGSHGEVLDYVEAHTVIQRLNDAFEGKWSFAVVDHDVKDDDAVVLAMLEADGVSKMQFGSARLTRAKADGSPVSLGDDLKAAATDALKKCATLMGVGLYLYGAPARNGQEAAPSNGTKSDGEGSGPKPATEAQIRAISAIARSKEIPEDEVRRICLEQFGVDDPHFLSRQDASDFIRLLQSGRRGA